MSVGQLILEWSLSRQALTEHVHALSHDVRVVTEDDGLAASLRESQIPVIHADPADRETLQEFASFAEVVLVAGPTPKRSYEIATAARMAFGHTAVIGVAGREGTHAQRSRITDIADWVIDSADVLAEEVLWRSTSPTAIRSYRVRSVLEELDGDLSVIMHDNPDPDAIASAVALVALADRFGVAATPCYFGEITHQSNRAFVNLFDLDLRRIGRDEDPPGPPIALVDHAIPGVNDSLAPDTPIAMIFDHHAPSGPVEAQYVDLRESVGATSSIMVEYLRHCDIAVDESMASALLYGVRTDTKDFSRQVTPVDFEAARFLWPRADQDALARIEHPGVTGDTLETIADAISHRRTRGPYLSACVGEVGERDAISQASELLIQLDGIHAVLVYGFRDGIAYASARARGGGYPIDLAAVMRDAFGQIGTAGGHEEMAGAQIPLGVLQAAGLDESDDPITEARTVIDERFFEAITDMLTIGPGISPPRQDRSGQR